MNDFDKSTEQNIAESCTAFLREFRKRTGIDVKDWRVDKMLPSRSTDATQPRQICITITY